MGLSQYQSVAPPDTQKLTRLSEISTGIAKELHSPDKLENVQDPPEAGVELEEAQAVRSLG